MNTDSMHRFNNSLPDGSVPTAILKETSQAECVAPIDQSGWINPNSWDEPFVLRPEVMQSWNTVCTIGFAGTVHVASADGDEYIDCHSSISYPAQFEVKVCDIYIGGGAVLRPNEPLVLLASLCDPDGCYRADVPGIGTPLAAFSPEEMIDAFTDLLAHLWKEYALEEDANLKPRARRLKERILRDYTVVR